MKLLIVTPRFFPEPFSINEICNELIKQGHDITVLTGRPYYGLWKFYPGYEKYKKYQIINGIKVIRVNDSARKNNRFSIIHNYINSYLLYKKELKRIHDNFDAVLSHGLSPLFCLNYTHKFCKKRSIPNIFYGLDLWPESFVASSNCSKNSILYKLITFYSKRLYRKFNEIIYASPSACEYIKNNLKIQNHYYHIYQPCLCSPIDINEVRKHEYLKDGKLHILYCGTIAKFNHLDIIIDSIRLFKHKTKIVFDIVGSGSDENNVKQLVKENNLSDIIIFHGRVDPSQTREFYKKSDVLFVPLYWNCETSNMIPQKVIECFLYNRPILGMIKGDGADLIKKAGNNVLCDQTPESICDALNSLLNLSTTTLNDIGNSNRDFFDNNSRFKIDTIVSELVNEIEKFLN